jgi:hypothetical protein
VLNYTKDDFQNIVGRVYNRRKKTHGGQVPGSRSGHFDHLKTEQGVAEQFGVSPRTVGRVYNRRKKRKEDNLKKGIEAPKCQNDTSENTAEEITWGDRKSSGHFDHSKTEHDVADQFEVSLRKEKAPAKMTRAGQNNK